MKHPPVVWQHHRCGVNMLRLLPPAPQSARPMREALALCACSCIPDELPLAVSDAGASIHHGEAISSCSRAASHRLAAFSFSCQHAHLCTRLVASNRRPGPELPSARQARPGDLSQ